MIIQIGGQIVNFSMQNTPKIFDCAVFSNIFSGESFNGISRELKLLKYAIVAIELTFSLSETQLASVLPGLRGILCLGTGGLEFMFSQQILRGYKILAVK